MRVCRAVHERIERGIQWSATDYYKDAVAQIEAGRVLWGCRSREEFDRRCVMLDRLIEGIERQGYKSAEERSVGVGTDSLYGHSEVLVNLSRDGLPLFQDGRHRLAIARALGIAEIPVQVLVRHAAWQSFREFMVRMASADRGASKRGYLYQNPTHFDLNDIPYEHGCDDRWAAIAAALDAGAGRALDIGCNLGYFCNRLASLGYSVTGVEYLPDIAFAAGKIASAERRGVNIIQGDILDQTLQQQLAERPFEVVLAINIFHHFIKTESGFRGLERLLGGVKMRTMFFQPHKTGEPQMAGAFAKFSSEEFVTFVRERSGFSSAAPIFTASDGRSVFKLSR